MDSIEINPFRILGIKSNASLKEITGSEVTIKRYIEIGETPVLKFDLTPPLKDINRTEKGITKAKNQLHHPKDKLVHSLFWFVSSGPIDDIALSKLTDSKDTETALETFLKGSKNFKLSIKTSTCILNHSTLDLILYHEHKDEERLFNALKRKLELLADKDVVNHIENLVTGDKHKINYSSVKEEVYAVVKTILKETFPRRKQSKLLLSLLPPNSDFKKEIEVDIVNEILAKISVETKKFDEIFERESIEAKGGSPSSVPKRKKDAILNAGLSVVTNTKKHYLQLLNLLDKSDYQFEKTIDDIFGRANISVIHLYNNEMDYINHKIRRGETSFISSLNFNVYSKNLHFFKTQVAPYNCDIKSTINKNYSSICEVCEDIKDLKRRHRTSYRSPSYSSRGSYSSGGSSNESVSPGVGVFFGIIFLIIMIARNC